jgi:hypothetical protein
MPRVSVAEGPPYDVAEILPCCDRVPSRIEISTTAASIGGDV